MPPRFLTPATAALTRISFSAVWLTPPVVPTASSVPFAGRPPSSTAISAAPRSSVPLVPLPDAAASRSDGSTSSNRGALQGGVAVLGPRGGDEDEEEGREGDSRKQQGEAPRRRPAARPRPTAPDAGHQRLCLMPAGTWDQSFYATSFVRDQLAAQ
ncbi:hypothetical protein THAOC_32310, partial [Thalassiosira oceanica]